MQRRSIVILIFLAVQWISNTASEANKENSNSIWKRFRRSDVQEVCESYRGTTCSKYLGNNTIFIKASSKLNQDQREGRVTLFSSVIRNYVSNKCRKVLIPSLCYYFFPPCIQNVRTPTPRQICRDECHAVKNNLCKTEMESIQSMNLKILRSASNCSNLPGRNSKGHRTCIKIGAVASQRFQFSVTLENITMYEGKPVSLKCKLSSKKVRGNITWYKDGQLIGRKHCFKTRQYRWGSRLKIRRSRPKDSGKYDCVVHAFGQTVTASSWVEVKPLASETFRTSKKTDRANCEDRTVKPTDPSKRRVCKGCCEPYRGKVCKQYLSGKKIFVTNFEHQEKEELKVAAAIRYIQSSVSISARCLQYGIPAMCYFYFPACEESTGHHKHRLCREDCNALYDDICLTELQIAKFYSNSLLSTCNELPLPGTNDSSFCSPLGIQVQSTPGPFHTSTVSTCYDGNGGIYSGRQNVSRSGLPCLSWAGQLPNVNVTHNYCRSFNGTNKGPWCYIARGISEECDIPKCEVPASESPEVLKGIVRASRTIYVIAIIMSVLIIAFVSIMVYLKVQHVKWGLPSKRSSTGSISKSTQSTLQPPSVEVTKSMTDIKSCILNEVQEVSQGKVKFLEVLGEGGFAQVCKGALMINDKDMSDLRIAIKKLKHDSPTIARENLRIELNILAKLQDINLLCLVGFSAGDEPLFMVFEYYGDMDLHRHITFGCPTSCESHSIEGIEEFNLLDFAMQIASGMEFLAENHFIHRDLATRNCFITPNCIVKISNLGIGCYKYPADYSWIHGSSLLPVRWMSPEALNTIRFSHRSDIWSYGVVLWELYTYGRQPYIGCTNQEAIERIRSFDLLTCPDDCPARMYALMRECWEGDPCARPDFSEITSRIRTWAGDSLDNSH